LAFITREAILFTLAAGGSLVTIPLMTKWGGWRADCLYARSSALLTSEIARNSISRIPINKDGSSGEPERVLHMPRHVPDGGCFDEDGRLWIACHRPDKICVFDVTTRRLEVFAEDWQGEALRGPCHVAFAGPNRDILLASSLDKATVHRFDQPGVRGLRLNNPKL